MKKTLLFAAAIATAMVANAEVFDYGFSYDSPAFPFFAELNNEESEFYTPGNYEWVNKYGTAMPNYQDYKLITAPEEEGGKGTLKTGLCISMLDGRIYKLNPNVEIDEEFAEEIIDMPQENWEFPFLSWGEKGVTRTLLMPGWGTTDEWADANYNAATPEDWVACKNGVQFTRLGTDGIVSRGDTYFQYPAVTGNVTLTVWASANLGGTANTDNLLEVAVTPVVDGVAGEPIILSKANPADKRYYKLDPIKMDATGKNVVFRVGANNSQLNLMYVRIEGEKGVNAVEGIQAVAAESAAYNMLGVQVDENYKGLVIKNGKKFIQK